MASIHNGRHFIQPVYCSSLLAFHFFTILRHWDPFVKIGDGTDKQRYKIQNKETSEKIKYTQHDCAV